MSVMYFVQFWICLSLVLSIGFGTNSKAKFQNFFIPYRYTLIC